MAGLVRNESYRERNVRRILRVASSSPQAVRRAALRWHQPLPPTAAQATAPQQHCQLVKEYDERILLDEPTHCSPHSLPAGVVTEATEHGVPDRLMTRTTGHLESRPLTRCDRPCERFGTNALQGEWS